MHNFEIHLNKDNLQAMGTLSTFFKPSKSISPTRLLSWHLLRAKVTSLFSAITCSMRAIKKIPTNGLPTRTCFQRFLSKTLHSLFKKLIISTPLLLQGLHTMSLAKSLPYGLKPQECKRLRLREPPPVPYMHIKDEVQEEVSKMRNLQIKTSLKKNTTLNFPMWHDNGTKEALRLTKSHIVWICTMYKFTCMNSYKCLP